ncbi:asparagine synthase (glutamine-hydrolyzing) [Actinokineospora sp. HUAS TT18]|uniref:asparagine synthase (glutamine-hydrolyzing) n=1 Tax=Actinokineospora sp. HUAS TT18 TaxID=3447451 RepID=UPI003F527695
MCRIYGSFGDKSVDSHVLAAVAEAQVHGGPDAQTVVNADTWALGNNRLAIQGIAAGEQPFRLDGLTCVFNGEIYNHRALRAELGARGYRFNGDCDGDVLLPLYELYGDEFVSRLEGMYAIAIVDTRAEPCLKLFVDHAGMKSLYYYVSDGSQLNFASELRALAKFPDFPDRIDPLAVDRYLGGKAVWGPETIYSQVRTLVPGTVLRFSADGWLTERQIDLAPREFDWPEGGPTRAAAAEILDGLLHDELSRMLDADVPVCVITSGGLDSSYITGMAKSLVPDLASFNIAYAGTWPSDERHFADEVARHVGTRHHQVLLEPAEFPGLIDRFLRHLDQPNNAPHSLSTYGLFEAIHDAGFKVALTGDGADELFSGYARYVKAARDGSATWHRSYQDTMAAAGPGTLSTLYSTAFRAEVAANGGYFADQSGDELVKRVRGADKLETLLRYDQFERFPYYILRRVDHLSMAHSVEARIPFLQPSVMRFSRALPTSLKVVDELVKTPVADAARRWIPQSIVDRPKQPFTLPIAAMIRPGEALHDLIGDVLLSSAFRCKDYFDQRKLRELFQLQTDNPSGHAAEVLWSVLMLELWLSVRDLTP